MQRNWLAWGVAGLLGLTSSIAGAHTLMTSPSPRDDSDSHKDPNGPCGVARAASQPMNAPALAPGSTLSVTWTETVDHPGCFVIDFASANDTGWSTLATVAHSSTGATPRPYSTEVTLPDTDCAECTLRIRQIMLSAEPAPGAACPPSDLQPGQTYYTCANVALVGAATVGKPKSDASSDGSCAYAQAPSSANAAWRSLFGLALVGCTLRARSSGTRARARPSGSKD